MLYRNKKGMVFMRKEDMTWKPMGGDYMDRPRAEALKMTDEYFEKLHKRYKQVDASAEGLGKKIDNWLKKGERQDSQWLVDAVLSDEYIEMCHLSYDFFCFGVVTQISCIEKNFEQPQLWFQLKSVGEANELMQVLTFYLRRIEFDFEEEYLTGLMEFISENNITYICMGEAIAYFRILQKLKVSIELFRLYIKYGRKKEGILFLFYMARKLECDEEVLLKFCVELIEIGENYWILNLLSLIENPSEKVRQLQERIKEQETNGSS